MGRNRLAREEGRERSTWPPEESAPVVQDLDGGAVVPVGSEVFGTSTDTRTESGTDTHTECGRDTQTESGQGSRTASPSDVGITLSTGTGTESALLAQEETQATVTEVTAEAMESAPLAQEETPMGSLAQTPLDHVEIKASVEDDGGHSSVDPSVISLTSVSLPLPLAQSATQSQGEVDPQHDVMSPHDTISALAEASRCVRVCACVRVCVCLCVCLCVSVHMREIEGARERD